MESNPGTYIGQLVEYEGRSSYLYRSVGHEGRSSDIYRSSFNAMDFSMKTSQNKIMFNTFYLDKKWS
jgi:hypothetical protein